MEITPIAIPQSFDVHHHQAIEASDNVQPSLLRGPYDLRIGWVPSSRLVSTAESMAAKPPAMVLQCACTGERDYFEVMESTTWHMMDIDLIHHSSRNPLEVGGVRIHGDNHVQYNCEGAPGLSLTSLYIWTEGLLEDHFLTGHLRPLRIAKCISNCLLRMVDVGWGVPSYKVRWHSARDSGWLVIALTALYEATGASKWLEPCHHIAQGMLDQHHPDGSWDLRLGWYNGNYTPLQIGIALTGSEPAKEGLLKAAQALIEKCSFPEGMLW